MKRTLFLLLLLLLLPNTVAQAQTAVTLQSLEVELWPDYDNEAVLVLLTGTLPASTPLPATLTFPLPDGADFNVVARITPDNVMTDQGMTPQVGENQVTFTTSESRFRVEYYQPYIASNTQRAFTFSWQSDIAVEQMNVTIQQPIAATDVSVIPEPTSVSQGQDGLTYHVLPNQAVAAGDTYSVEVDYTMSVPQLTVSFSAPDDTDAGSELPFLDAVPVEGSGFDWPVLLIAFGVLILVVTAVWYLLSRQSASTRRPARPKPQRPKPARKTAVNQAASPTASKAKANFCHQCGQPLTDGDKFCRNCGTAIKAK